MGKLDQHSTDEDAVISKKCDIEEFVGAIKDLDYLNMIYMAEKEATEAERLKYRLRGRVRSTQTGCPSYADLLKSFISYMRYGVKVRLMEEQHLKLFRPLRDAVTNLDGDESKPEACAESL